MTRFERRNFLSMTALAAVGLRPSAALEALETNRTGH
jgi:hypothetical protein